MALLAAVHQFDQRHLGTITLAVTQFENSRIATWALSEARADRPKKCKQHFGVRDFASSLPTRMEIAPLSERDQALRERPQLLRLGDSSVDPAVAKQAHRHVTKQCLAVARRPA